MSLEARIVIAPDPCVCAPHRHYLRFPHHLVPLAMHLTEERRARSIEEVMVGVEEARRDPAYQAWLRIPEQRLDGER